MDAREHSAAPAGARDRAAPTSAPAVVVAGASKAFQLPHERVNTLKERVLHPLRGRSSERFEALRDVSFSVQPGEFFGIVGRNGSGKSTLLKCLAGIYALDAGNIWVNGRLSTFIELGVGFNPDLAARDNVVMNAIMLGLSPKEARARFDEVIAFAELEEFVDLKLKNYSSGMHVRLAFAVLIQVDADVLLVDEVLAVGDASFQQKCFDVFNRLRDEGRTLLFVTHDMAAVNRFCHRALLLERGEVVEIGEPARIGSRYLELNFAQESAEPDAGGPPRAGDGSARVIEAWMEDEHGRRQAALPQGRPATFKARVAFHEAVDDPSFAVAFVNEHRQNLFVASSASLAAPPGPFRAGETAVFSVSFENAFAPGRYHLSTLVTRGGQARILDRWERLTSLVVTGAEAAGGLVDLAHDLAVEREPAAAASSSPTASGAVRS